MKNSENRILDAAERVVVRDGVAHLTLDAVAAEAALSKGGVLYHFHSKDDLIRGMIARLSSEFNSRMAQLERDDPDPKGRTTRAYLAASVPSEPSEAAVHFDAVSASLLAAVATNPSLLDPVHEQGMCYQRRLEADGIDPVLATIVRLAADGLWLAGLFGVPSLQPALRAEVLARLRSFTTYENCLVNSSSLAHKRR